MAKRATKASRQRAELSKAMKTGPWQYSDQVRQFDRGDGRYEYEHPYRMTDASFDETDYDSVRGVIDAEHARAIVMGKQTASQFGYGVYDVHFHLMPSENALNPDSTENGLGEFGLHFFQPTPLRLDALKALKSLERTEDEQSVFESGSQGAANPAGNPLLSMSLEEVEDSQTDTSSTPVKGSRIIRFGWSGQTSQVVQQSALTVNLNPSSDEDTNDAFENQAYVLTGGDGEHFGIMQRMERSINPMVQDGQPMVLEEWAHPVNLDRVQKATTLRAPCAWGIADSSQGTANSITASFYGVHAVGGLMGFTLPGVFVQQGTGNNDYDIVVTVKSRKWVPLA